MLLVLPAELEILREMRPLDRDVFNYLAERVDYNSGVIGRSRRVSYGGMALDLSERDVARRVKSTLVKVTSKDLINTVTRLVNAGLLSRMSAKGFGHDLVLSRVFFVQLLSADNSVQNPVGNAVGFQLGMLLKKLTNNNNDLQSNNESSQSSVGNAVGITSLQHTSTPGDDKFLMSLDWKPDQGDVVKILAMSGLFYENVKADWVNEFVSHWFSEGERKLTQRQWTVKLARLLVDYLSHPGLFEQRRGIGKAVKSAGFKNLAVPEWARIPRDDEQMVAFMRHFGYGEPDVGISYQQARVMLVRKVEIRLTEWKKGLS